MPFALLWLEIKSIGKEVSKDILDMLVMSGEVRGVDEYVIKVDHNPHVQYICKDVIDEMLESVRGVSETKGHHQPLEEAIAVGEGGLPFISISNADQMISMLEIEFGVDLSSIWGFKQVGDGSSPSEHGAEENREQDIL